MKGASVRERQMFCFEDQYYIYVWNMLAYFDELYVMSSFVLAIISEDDTRWRDHKIYVGKILDAGLVPIILPSSKKEFKSHLSRSQKIF